MRPDDLLRLLRHQPFQLFRIVLTDGTTYDIHHPHAVFVGRSTLQVGSPSAQLARPVWDREVVVALIHIIRLEPIEPRAAAPAAANP